jgi:hypothetical protein
MSASRVGSSMRFLPTFAGQRNGVWIPYPTRHRQDSGLFVLRRVSSCLHKLELISTDTPFSIMVPHHPNVATNWSFPSADFMKKASPVGRIIAALLASLAIAVITSSRAPGTLHGQAAQAAFSTVPDTLDDHSTELVQDVIKTGLGTRVLEQVRSSRRSLASNTSQTFRSDPNGDRSRIVEVVRIRFDFALALAFASSGATTTHTTSVPPPLHA